MKLLTNELALRRLLAERTTSELVDDLNPVFPSWSQMTAENRGAEYRREDDIQLTGSSWLIKHKNGILADIQGQGKTKMVYDALEYLYMDNQIRTALILCKASSIDPTWLEDFKFISGRCAIEVLDYRGTVTQRHKVINREPADPDALLIGIMSYAIYRQDYEVISRLYWDVVVLDECQYIRGTPLNDQMSQIGERIHELTSPDYKWLLSGTPWVQHGGDMWNQLKFIGFEGRSWERYKAEVLEVKEVPVAQYGGYHGKQVTREKITGIQEAALIDLSKTLGQCMIRRTDRSHLPPLMPVQQIRVLMHAADAAEYVKLDAERRHEEALLHGNGDGSARPELVRAKMHELCSGNKAKIEAAQEIVEAAVANDDKCIIYTTHIQTLRTLYKHFKHHGLVYIMGQVSTQLDSSGTSERARMITQFQNDPQCRVLIATCQAAGEGLPLTAANHVIFMDRPSSPTQFEQCLTRPVRWGQTKPVFPYVLIATYYRNNKVNDTLEGSVDATYARKLAPIQKVFG